MAHSAGLGTDELNNIDVYKASKQSVVYITSTVIQRTFFFTQEGQALGSGFIIDADGQILTNYHVISGSSDTEVTLPDQSTYKAKILVRDRQDDLAVIKIEPRQETHASQSGRFRSSCKWARRCWRSDSRSGSRAR